MDMHTKYQNAYTKKRQPILLPTPVALQRLDQSKMFLDILAKMGLQVVEVVVPDQYRL
jgi:hypothetical protein